MEKQGKQLITWCKDKALPLWASKGVDPQGGFWEALYLDATPISESLRRVRVQARQTFVYAQAFHLGWYAGAKETSDHGWAYLTGPGFLGADKFGALGGSGCAHLLNSDGSIHDAHRDTYAQAFVILASAWRWRAFGCHEAKTVLAQTCDFLETHLKSDKGGWNEGVPATLPRRQNPHMHLFEAFVAAYEATQDSAYLDLADRVYNLFENYFFDKDTGTLLEFFESDWSPDPKTGKLIEPGHMMEWCWLLYKYGRLSGKDISGFAERLYGVGCAIGTNKKTGLLINEATIYGDITKPDSRCWIQTEHIKANVARARAGYADATDQCAYMIGKLFKNYLTVPVAGGWHDQRSAYGVVTSNTMPSSTFYHLFGAAVEVHDYLNF